MSAVIAEPKRQRQEDRRARLHPMQRRSEDAFNLLKGPVKKAMERQKIVPRPECEIELKGNRDTDRLEDIEYRLAADGPLPGDEAEVVENDELYIAEVRGASTMLKMLIPAFVAVLGGSKVMGEVVLERVQGCHRGKTAADLARENRLDPRLLRRVLREIMKIFPD